MLRKEIEQYIKLTGEDGLHVPIMKLGAYLDGYNKGLKVLDKIRDEIGTMSGDIETIADILAIIDKYKAEAEA